jgi:tyrosine-specific transport protein
MTTLQTENPFMSSKLIGSILLIIGTTIGGGMLALPVVTAAGGFIKSSLLMTAVWAIMTVGALLILEVNLWFPENSHLISMAKKTLGKPGVLVCWISCVMVLYCVLSAYIAGGTDLTHQLLANLDIHAPFWISTLLFVFIFAIIVWFGIRVIDHFNRAFMSVKMLAYALLVILIAPVVNPHLLPNGQTTALLSAILVILTSFGYATIIPSLRTYLKSDVKKLRFAIILGGFVPLVCYILWDYTVQGSISQAQLVNLNDSASLVTQLTQGVSNYHRSISITNIAHIFTTICVLTAFLGVSLSLSDFLADGFKIKKQGLHKWLLYFITFAPPTAIILFNPKMFIEGLRYAGFFCVIIFLILPALMAWRGRYHQKIAHGYQVIGGKLTLLILLVISVFLLCLAFVK